MSGVGDLWAWMSRPDVVLAVSVIAIVLSLVGLALSVAQEQRRG
jgi:hypothetical protein